MHEHHTRGDDDDDHSVCSCARMAHIYSCPHVCVEIRSQLMNENAYAHALYRAKVAMRPVIQLVRCCCFSSCGSRIFLISNSLVTQCCTFLL